MWGEGGARSPGWVGGAWAAPSSRLLRATRQVGRAEAAPAFSGPGVEGAQPAENAAQQGPEGALRPEKPGLAGRRVTPRGRAVGTRGHRGGAAQPAALFLGAAGVPGHSSSPAPSACPEWSSLGHAGLGQWGLGMELPSPTLSAKAWVTLQDRVGWEALLSRHLSRVCSNVSA